MSAIKKVLCTDLLLTGTSVAVTAEAEPRGRDQHILYVKYSPDTNSTNALEVVIEMSPDGTNYFPITDSYTVTSGTTTPNTAVTLSFGSDGTSDQLESPFKFDGAAEKIRVKVKETNTPADFGNVSLWLISTNS